MKARETEGVFVRHRQGTGESAGRWPRAGAARLTLKGTASR
ncbi:hypothetical protein IW256_005909 [Actinomadura viridis]|uniref:Uncharacterized protein n=1 Tax=Actinomadura viridis TaxID=58110 RepID=A0A931DQ89_9ACTN|nr:hypothetical protein [Actinomadura viridis]